MDIKAYQEQTGCTLAWLAKRAGCNSSTLHAIKTGRAKPSLALALRLEEVTAGAIAPRDFATIKTGE